VVRDISVLPSGQRKSVLGIDTTGSQFELWTVKNDTLEEFHLATRYVGAYVPKADIVIHSGDPYQSEGVVRTRADQPFTVVTTVSNLLSEPEAPDAAKQVTYLHHKQAYGTEGETNDPSQAILHAQKTLHENRDYTDYREITVIPGGDRLKVWGEERFSVYSLPDGEAPAAELVSKTIKVYPISSGLISGLPEVVRFAMPEVTFSAWDVYPDEGVFVRIYPANKPEEAKRLPIAWTNTDEVPAPVTLTRGESDWTGVVTEDGTWTLELWAENPYFGNHQLDAVSFDYESSLRVNSLVGSME